ncbi:hypothetical protein [Methanogenium organophilum]|uniref:Uncharacterized protein n=1 Tax=Methanogenium organophilum TaxID=2199 RepID=A0A9X9S534_METOG|nr:hypothetical protein [Methanogenium organophilum]WAI01070.1 hypothetical protein OU421_11710 [Methanogenium organophilum]
MEIKRVLKNIDVLLKYGLIAILLLSFLIHIFVFIINWEAFIFGIRLAGPPAGLYLFLEAIGAGSLAFLLIKYRQYTTAVFALAVLYFGYLFLDSAVTIQTLTDKLYSPVLLMVFIISFGFLIFHALISRFCADDDRPTMIESAIHSICTKIMTQETEEDKIIIGTLLVIVIFIAVIIILPLTIAFIFSLMELF